MQDRPAAGGHGVDIQHRRAHAHAGDLGLEGALIAAGIVRDIGGGAAHVEADNALEAGSPRRLDRADNAARRPREDGVLSLEAARVHQPAIGLHEEQPRPAERRRHALHMAAQDRREIGVHHRRVAARDELHQRRDLVADRDLLEAGAPRDLFGRGLVGGVAVAVHQADGDGPEALSVRPREVRRQLRLVERLHGLAMRAQALVRLHDLGIEDFRQPDMQVEQARAVLVADAELVGEALCHHQQGALALALQQRVGRNRGAHAHGLDAVGRDRRIAFRAQDVANALERRVVVMLRRFGEQLAGDVAAVRPPGHDVGEGSAPVDPELPAAVHAVPLRRISSASDRRIPLNSAPVAAIHSGARPECSSAW